MLLKRVVLDFFGRYRMHFSTLVSLMYILLFFLFICHIQATPLPIETLGDDDDICRKIDCGQGNCVPANTSFLGVGGFDCVCKPGWQKPQFGPFTFPTCTVPNCTINHQCSNGTPPLTPPPPPANIPLLTPCTLVWCGDGSCVVNGSGYYCKCNEGSANLFNLTGVACFKQCYLGADCPGVSLGSPVSPPPPSGTSMTPPSGNASGSPPSMPPPSVNGISHVPARSLGQVFVLLVSVIVLLPSI